MKQRIAIIVLVLLAIAGGVWLLWGGEPTSDPATGQREKDLSKQASVEREETNPKGAKHPKAGSELGATEVPAQEASAEEPQNLRVRFRIVPTIGGKHDPTLWSLRLKPRVVYEGTHYEDCLEESPEHFVSPPHADCKFPLRLLVLSPARTFERSFQIAPTPPVKGVVDLGVIEVEFSEILDPSNFLIRGKAFHRSGIPLSKLGRDGLGLLIGPAEEDRLDYKKRKSVTVAEDGTFWVVHTSDRMGFFKGPIVDRSEQDITALRIWPRHQKQFWSFQSKQDGYYDFGSLTIGGALLEIDFQANLQKPLLWEGQPAGEGELALPDKDSYVSLYLQTTRDLGRFSGERMGGGRFHALALAPPQTFGIRAEVNLFEEVDDVEYFHPTLIHGDEGAYQKIRIDYQAPPLSAVTIRRADGKEVTSGRYGFFDTSGKPDIDDFLFEKEEGDEPEKPWNFNSRYYGKPVVFDPKREEKRFGYYSAEFKQHFVDFQEGARVYELVLKTRKEPEPEDEEEEENIPVFKVRFDWNGWQVPQDCSLQLLLFSDGRYYSGQMIKVGAKPNGIFEAQMPDEGEVASLHLRDPSARWGFEEIDLVKPAEFNIEEDRTSREVTLKLLAPPKWAGPIEGEIIFRAFCEGHPVEWWSPFMPIAGGMRGFEPYDHFTSEHTIEVGSLKRVDARNFEYHITNSHSIEVTSRFARHLPSLEIAHEAYTSPIAGAGTIPLYLYLHDGKVIEQPIRIVSKLHGQDVVVWQQEVEGEVGELRADQPPTLVTIRGKSGDVRWVLRRENYSLALDKIQDGRIGALMPGKYQWHGLAQGQSQYSEFFEIVEGPPIELEVPTFEAPPLGELHVKLSDDALWQVIRDELRFSTLFASEAEDEPFILRKGVRYNDSTLMREARLEGSTLILTGIPRNKALVLFAKIRRQTRDASLLSSAPIPIFLKEDQGSIEVTLGEIFPVVRPPEFPRAPKDSALLDGNNTPNASTMRISYQGKVLYYGEGLRLGREYEVEVRDPRLEGQVWKLKVRVDPKSGEAKWEDGALEKLQPMYRALEALNQADENE